MTENAHVRTGFSADTVGWAFSTGACGNWHPLTWMSHALDCQIFGLNPVGHHLVSVALHAANAALLFLALHALTGAVWRSAAVAALFAVHPLHVESVAWVAERKDVLSTFFGLLALLAYARDKRLGVIATFALSLMSKPMMVTLPFVLLLLDRWPLDRWSGTVPPAALIREKLPLFAMAGASCVVTVLVQQKGGAVQPLEFVSPATRLANAAVSYVAYLAKAFWPVSLAPLYPLAKSIPVGTTIGAVAILTAVTVGVLLARKSAPYLAAGWLWYLGMLVPVIGIVQVGVQSIADRYTYLPLAGIFVMVVWGAVDLAARAAIPRAVPATAAALALAACAVLTWRQVPRWRDSVTLFEHTLAVTSGNYIMHCDLGIVLLRDNRIDEGVAHLEEARRIRPDHAPTLSALGVVAVSRGRLDEAEALFRAALRSNPHFSGAQQNLRKVLETRGQLPQNTR